MHTKEPYQIIINNGLLDQMDDYVKKIYAGKNIFIISDERVASFYLEKAIKALKSYEVQAVVIKGYEEAKSLETYKEIITELLKEGIHRGDLIIALGGGVIGDLAGFVAATIFRGTPFIQVPTSLLAMVDSSIGGKTGIDFLGNKNMIGAFNQPKLVLIDPTVLKTLPERQMKNGYGEIIKHALIESDCLFNAISQNMDIDEDIIYQNLMIKKEYVEEDEFDKNLRMKLNFGHTFGHVLEMEHNLLHGEAVLSGMLCAIDLGIALKLTDSKVKEEVLNLYKKLGLNYIEVNFMEVLPFINMDKKNINGKINFILINKIGKSFIFSMKEEELWRL